MPGEKIIESVFDYSADKIDKAGDALASGVESAFDFFANIIDPPSKSEPSNDRQSNQSGCDCK